MALPSLGQRDSKGKRYGMLSRYLDIQGLMPSEYRGQKSHSRERSAVLDLCIQEYNLSIVIIIPLSRKLFIQCWQKHTYTYSLRSKESGSSSDGPLSLTYPAPYWNSLLFPNPRSFLTASCIPFAGSLCGPQALTSGPRSRPLRSDVVLCLGDVNFLA